MRNNGISAHHECATRNGEASVRSIVNLAVSAQLDLLESALGMPMRSELKKLLKEHAVKEPFEAPVVFDNLEWSGRHITAAQRRRMERIRIRLDEVCGAPGRALAGAYGESVSTEDAERPDPVIQLSEFGRA